MLKRFVQHTFMGVVYSLVRMIANAVAVYTLASLGNVIVFAQIDKYFHQFESFFCLNEFVFNLTHINQLMMLDNNWEKCEIFAKRGL